MTKRLVNDAVLVPTAYGDRIERVISLTGDGRAIIDRGNGHFQVEPKEGWQTAGHFERRWSFWRDRWKFIPNEGVISDD